MMEIACDESGYEGEKLVGGVTDVFAHASVRIDADTATDCIRELRNRIRSPATQYKAGHVLREKHRPVLEWLLGPEGPLLGNGRVYVVDKAFFVVSKLVDLLGEPADDAVTLYREGRHREHWVSFLVSANNLLRTKNTRMPVDSFFHMLDLLRRTDTAGPLDDVLARLRRARPSAEALRTRLAMMIPPMDPLVPAIVHAVEWWGEGDAVVIVHDRQTTLSPERIAQIQQLCRLTSLRLVVAEEDSRVQMADFLAGVARKIASDEINGRGDAELTALARPYLDSIAPGWP